MEIEEQAVEETGESRFSNVLGTRTITYYAFLLLLNHFRPFKSDMQNIYCIDFYFFLMTMPDL